MYNFSSDYRSTPKELDYSTGRSSKYMTSPTTDNQLSFRSNAPSPGQPLGSTYSLSRGPATQSTPNASYMEADKSHPEQVLNTTWDYMQAEMDLSPRTPQGHLSRSQIGSYRESNTGTGHARIQSPSPNRIISRSPHSLKDNYSTLSKEDNTPSRKSSSQVSDRAVTHEDIQQSVMSYRERWQRSRRDRESLRLNRSSSEPNRGSNDSHDSQSNGFHRDTGYRSRSYDFADRNRSVLSSAGLDANQSLNTNRSNNAEVINRSNLTNITSPTYMDYSIQAGSLRRDPVTHRKIPTNFQNGNAKPIKDLNQNLSKSRGSLARSHSSVSRGSRKLTLYGNDYGVHNSLVSMALYSLLSLVFCVLGMQLLLRLSVREAQSLPTLDSVLQTNESYHQVQSVAVTFSSAVVMFNLCCLVTCSLQCFFAAKLIKCPQGEERSVNVLKANACSEIWSNFILRLFLVGGWVSCLVLVSLAIKKNCHVNKLGQNMK